MSITVSNLTVYPIKSSAGIDLSNAWLDELGLSFDRRFVLTETNGRFITARTDPRICLIQVNLTATGLKLIAPDMPVLAIEYNRFSDNYQDIRVWQDTIAAQHCLVEYDRWFSQYLGRDCQLHYFGEQSKRQVKDKTNDLSFADGYPVLLIGQASLDELNTRLPSPVTMSQFRPNIVVEGTEAFQEDQWAQVRIGEVEFEVTKPCTRCDFTTVDPDTAEFHPKREPINTLKQYRKAKKGGILFGQNLVPLNQGQIKQGDTLTIVSTKAAPEFV